MVCRSSYGFGIGERSFVIVVELLQKLLRGFLPVHGIIVGVKRVTVGV